MYRSREPWSGDYDHDHDHDHNYDDFPRQRSGADGININIQRHGRSPMADVTIDGEQYTHLPHGSLGRGRRSGPDNSRPLGRPYARTWDRALGGRPPTRHPSPSFNRPRCAPSPPPRHDNLYHSISHHNNDVTVILPRNETAIINRRLLEEHLPNIGHSIHGTVLDIPAYLREEHRPGVEDDYPEYNVQLTAVARHVFTFFEERVEANFSETFNEWRATMADQDPRSIHLIALRAFSMCCLFDQFRSLGCSEAIGAELTRFIAQLLPHVFVIDELFVPFLFGGVARMFTTGRFRQQHIFRQMWDLIDAHDPGMARGIEMSYRETSARGGIEGGRARHVLRLIAGGSGVD